MKPARTRRHYEDRLQHLDRQLAKWQANPSPLVREWFVGVYRKRRETVVRLGYIAKTSAK